MTIDLFALLIKSEIKIYASNICPSKNIPSLCSNLLFSSKSKILSNLSSLINCFISIFSSLCEKRKLELIIEN